MAKSYHHLLRCGVALGVLLAPLAAHAQDETAPPVSAAAEAEGDAGPLGEIIVTANRRATNLQNTAISITAIGGEMLETQGINDTIALQQVTPGLTFNQNSSFAQPYIRGIGTDITTPGSESSVATFIDGVYQPFPFVGVQVLNAIESIEVLKGPQGTLYGRNATGGSINVQTRNPDKDFVAEGDFTYGNFDAKLGRVYISVPLGDNLAFNVAGAISSRDGYGTNLTTGEDYNRENYKYIRGKLRWNPTDTLEVLLSGYYFRRNDDSNMAYTYDPRWGSIPAPTALGGNVSLLSHDVYTAYPLINRIRDYGGNLRLNLEAGPGTLTSITAFQRARAFIGPDFVSTDVPIFDFQADDTGRNFSQDLYYSGDLGDASFVVGGTYAKASARFDPLLVLLGTTPATNSFQYVDTEAFAAYGELTYKLSDRLSVTGGVRYSNEKKTQDRLDTFLPDGTQIVSTPRSSRRWDNVSFKALAQYDLGDAMVYAKFESGFKSGSVIAAEPGLYVEPETIDSWEVGLKSELLDRTLRFNVAGFYYTYKNVQVQYTDTTTGQALVESADKARIWGVEAQLTAAPSDNFTFNLGFNYLNSRYVDFISSGAFVPNTILVGPGVPGNGNVTLDVAGNDLVRSPPITISTDVNWKVPFADGSSLNSSASLYFSDSYFFEVTNRTRQKAYAVAGAQIRYDFAGDKFSVAVFGRNLTNTRYLTSLAPNSFGDAGQLAPPRTYGVTLSAKY